MNWINAVRRLGPVYSVMNFARASLSKLVMHLAHAVKGVDPNKVIFSSFRGRSCTDSPRYISDELNRINPASRIVWHTCALEQLPEYAEAVRPHSVRALIEYATARVIVDNFNRPFHLIKFPDQIYVQTWHGERGFKKVLYDMDPDGKFPDYKYMDLAVSGSDFSTRVFRSGFRYGGEVMQLGVPRNDILVYPPEGLADIVRKRLEIPDGAKVLMYAPTFRDSTAGMKQAALIDLSAVAEELKRLTGSEWICLVRAHDQNSGIDAPGAVDVTSYPEMAELMLVTDVLITDYSSCAGDFALTSKPFFLWQPDREEYLKNDREFYFDLDSSPYPIARNMDELFSMFKELEGFGHRAKALNEFYGVTETGHAAEAVAKYINEKLSQSIGG